MTDKKTKKALAALDAMAIIWASEIKLHEMISSILGAPPRLLHDKIHSLMLLAFTEGAYRHYCDVRDGKVPKMTYNAGIQPSELARIDEIMSEATPTYDTKSEAAQAHQDKTEKIFNESMKPANITMATIFNAVYWGYRNETRDMKELAESITEDDFYTGSLLCGILRDYLLEQAEKEAEREER